jgi:hypothetical protein
MTVLSVDDVDMNQIIVQAFVARLGAHVDVAANGKEVHPDTIWLPISADVPPWADEDILTYWRSFWGLFSGAATT